MRVTTPERDSSPTLAPTPNDVLRAAERTAAWIHKTPLLENATLNALCSRRVLLKAEHLQVTGSYKVRGAVNNIRALQERHGPELRGVVAASSGNHGQAVAWAARRAGVAATIVLPANVVPVKRAAIEGYGASVSIVGNDPSELAQASGELADAQGLIEIEAFDHPLTIAGQGTCALEALRQHGGAVEGVVVPIGGGGLAAGSVLATLAAEPHPQVFAVEPAAAADTYESLARGERVTIPPPVTIADALLSRQPGRLTFEINRNHLAGVVTVSEREIARAMRLVAERAKQILEPSSAVPIAALLEHRIPGDGPVIAVLSGGNADLARLSEIWTEASRSTPDQPPA